MNELKKVIGGLSAQLAACVNAGFAVVFILFLIVLPAADFGFSSMSLTKIAFSGNFFTVLWVLILLIGALAAGVWPLFFKKVNPCILCPTAVWYLGGVLLAADPAMGFGSIINVIIVMAPWVLFTVCRKDTVVDFGFNINVTTTNNNGPKLPGQK